MEITEIQAQLKMVALFRRGNESLAQKKAELLKKWEEENDDLLQQIKFGQQELLLAEDILRQKTIEVYQETGEKKPVDGVGIRVSEEPIYDPAEAFEYAKEHGIYLSLDKKAFNKAMSISELRPGFVKMEPKITATIATDLSKVLTD